MNMTELGRKAQTASKALAIASTELKNAVLIKIADSLENQSEPVLAANDQDVLQGRKDGLSEALLDRLRLDSDRLMGVATDLRAVVSLPDPVGEIFDETILPNGLRVHKQRVPLGVLGVIYEARPNVTIDVAGLALKSGNAAILRGGSETQNSNQALVNLIQVALAEVGLPPDSILFVNDPDRQRVLELLQMHEYVDMLIPRGGAALHQFCRENSRIPVITGGIGICHLYVDDSADLESALKVVQNAKVQRPTVCNALDTVLIHRTVAAGFLPRLVSYLEKDGVKFRVNSSAIQYLREANLGLPASVQVAGPQDFDTEWLSLVLGLMVVDDLDQAIEHIALHSTGHSDGILTHNDRNASRFVAQVDSAVVYVNASTRFTDGAQLGLGAEVAISTQRLHARGPMALRELTTYKWVVRGDYHVRK